MGRNGLLICLVAGLVTEGCGGSSGKGTGGAGGFTRNGGAGGAATGGSTDAHTDGRGDGPLATCGTSNNESSGISCNTIEASGPCVTETVGQGLPPAPAGGTIVAGTYDLVASTVYPYADAGVDAAVAIDQGPRRQTSVVSDSGSTLTLETAFASGREIQKLNVILEASGSGLTLTPTCPLDDAGGSSVSTLPYTATASSTETRIILYDTLNFDHLRLDEYLKL
jgi:hypothetical protein